MSLGMTHFLCNGVIGRLFLVGLYYIDNFSCQAYRANTLFCNYKYYMIIYWKSKHGQVSSLRYMVINRATLLIKIFAHGYLQYTVHEKHLIHLIRKFISITWPQSLFNRPSKFVDNHHTLYTLTKVQD